jgi:hypothetical protein
MSPTGTDGRAMTWPEFNDQQWEKLSPSTRERAVAILREQFSDEDIAGLKAKYDEDPLEWWAKDEWHTWGGTEVRNALRDGGLVDADLPPDPETNQGNWDSFYIPVIEAVIGARDLPSP